MFVARHSDLRCLHRPVFLFKDYECVVFEQEVWKACTYQNLSEKQGCHGSIPAEGGEE